MKSLEINANERMLALTIFNNPQNTVATADFKIYIEDVAKFRLTDEYKEQIHFQEVTEENGNISWKWDDKGVAPVTIEIDEFTRKFLVEKLQARELSAADPLAPSVIALIEKLS